VAERGDRITGLRVSACRIPTDAPEADGTIDWSSTGLVVVEVSAGDAVGLGYTYAATAAAGLVNDILRPVVEGKDALATEWVWQAMVAAVRNVGWRGVAACAISAVDTALWDLKARLLGRPLAQLFGSGRETVPVYGSGGFTTYDDKRLAAQLGRWVNEDGCRWVKMKVGSDPEADPRRLEVARRAIGDGAGLMIDANGALARKPALRLADAAADLGVVWFEEPVSSDDLEGLRLLRDRAPAVLEIAAGEYGYDPFYFRGMLSAQAVDVLQADATRCCGYTGFLKAAALAESFSVPLSAHTAPALHLPVCCAVPALRHVEWFHDHARIESMLFDGVPKLEDGALRPDLSRTGHGLYFKRKDAERYAV
jgi:L-alanine-DL-glutamate epimerase-like enolase superfamily enzyme